MRDNNVYGDYFCGNEISAYGKEHGFVDYHTFAKAFDAVLNNDIMSNTAYGFGEWEEIISGEYFEDADGNERTYEEYVEDETGEIESMYPEVYQYFIVSDSGAELIKDYEVGLLWYNEKLDMYVWGITHWGTSWDYVLTDIRCNTGKI